MAPTNERLSGREWPWSPFERRLARHLASSGFRWYRRAPAQFWNPQIGIDIRICGRGQNGTAEAAFDRSALVERGVVVVRIHEESIDVDAASALKAIALSEPWTARRRALGLPPVGTNC